MQKIKLGWKSAWKKFRHRWSPTIPELDPTNRASRQEWILFMARHNGEFPMTELNSVLMEHVSRVTANKDVQELEKQGLVKRTRDSEGRAYVVPITQQWTPPDPARGRRNFLWNTILPAVVVALLLALIVILLKGY